MRVYLAKKIFLFSDKNVHQFIWSVMWSKSIIKAMLMLAFIESWWCFWQNPKCLYFNVGWERFLNLYKMVQMLWLIFLYPLICVNIIASMCVWVKNRWNCYCQISGWTIIYFWVSKTRVGSRENDSRKPEWWLHVWKQWDIHKDKLLYTYSQSTGEHLSLRYVLYSDLLLNNEHLTLLNSFM